MQNLLSACVISLNNTSIYYYNINNILLNEPRQAKMCLREFATSDIQTRLLSYGD